MFSGSHLRQSQDLLLALLLGKIFCKPQCIQMNKNVLTNRMTNDVPFMFWVW